MSHFTKRLATSGVLLLAALAFLWSTSVVAIPAPHADIQESVGQQESEAPNDSTIEAKTMDRQAGQWSKILIHESFQGVQIRIKEPKLCDTNVKQYAGYLDTAGDKHFFFWFFESRNNPETDPVTLWINGGPGQSSLLGAFVEMGPCKVKADASGLDFNPYSWTSNSSILFVDQPCNVGFSYGADSSSNAMFIAQDIYALLQVFFKEFPQYQKLDFHIAGETYGGHYVPAYGFEILKQNRILDIFPNPNLVHIKLKSILIGNGMMDPKTQFRSYSDMACRSSYGAVLTLAQCEKMDESYMDCADLIQTCYKVQTVYACVSAADFCISAMQRPYLSSGRSFYDIRTFCETTTANCYRAIDNAEAFLNKPEVQSELGVSPQKFKIFNGDIYNAIYYNGDYMLPYHILLPPLLENGIRVLLYAGDADFIVNWIGIKEFAHSLPWSGQRSFHKAPNEKWIVNGTHAGDFRTSGALTFLRIHGAGHYVPYDKPVEALEMFRMWLKTIR
ncbi:hypothetical protein BGW42_001564 [Actinomortierella wolfii]|nr:hypothetical protein BGW42_001564 [Actinomortierella wolfii]